MKRVVVLGAGFGGLEISTRLAERFGASVDIVLIDKADGFVFGFSKLDVMFGRTTADHVLHPYSDLAAASFRFVQTTIRSIDPVARVAVTDAGDFEADILVVALGADLHPSETPGLLEGGNEFYTVDGAFAARDVIADFGGGHVIVAVTSTPFKCPPAPSETALLMHDFLVEHRLREQSTISLVMPLPVPIPPSPDASKALLVEFAERGIDWHPGLLVRGVDATRSTALLSNDEEMPFDLLLAVPVHRAPAVVAASGLTVDGWIPVDPLTMETSFPGVFAVGDVTSVGTPKAGVFAEGQAAVAAERIAALIDGSQATSEYDGHGTCYLEFGGERIGRVEVTFRPGQAPSGTFEAPSMELTRDKAEFGSSRALRWFGRDWVSLGG